VTYDNSLKGFLDIGKAAGVAAGITVADDVDAKDEVGSPGATPPTRTPIRDKLAKADMEKQLEEQRLKYAKDLEEARSVADVKLKKVLEEEERKRVEKIAGEQRGEAAARTLVNREERSRRREDIGNELQKEGEA
jgi:hypothetical protein